MDANEQIRDAMRETMRERGMTRSQLAERLGIKQPSVSQLLNGTYGKVPQSLLDALNALGLELAVQPQPEEPLSQDELARWDAASAADLARELDELEADEDPEAVRAWLAAFEKVAK